MIKHNKEDYKMSIYTSEKKEMFTKLEMIVDKIIEEQESLYEEEFSEWDDERMYEVICRIYR